MKLIAGLGNPGRRYESTRHNVGFDVVDLLTMRHRADWESAPRGIEALVARPPAVLASGFSRTEDTSRSSAIFAKPLTYMNLSGSALVGLLQFYKIEPADLLVLVDDVNLELGRLRTRARGSAGGHNGLKSVIGLLGSEEFARLRIGVGRGDGRRDLADHVTAKFEAHERASIVEAVGRAADAAELFIAEGIGPVMNRYNRKEDSE